MKRKIGMVLPTWGQECGIAEYTKHLINNTTSDNIEFVIITSIQQNFISVIKQNNISLVHFQYEYSLYPIELLKTVMKELMDLDIPIVTTLHTWSDDLEFNKYNQVVAENSSRVIVHSDEMKRQCIIWGFPSENLVVIPMGTRSFLLKTAKQVRRVNHIDGEPAIGFFGFPFPHKGIDNLIEALNQLRKTYPNIKGYFLSHYPNYLKNHGTYSSFLQHLQFKFSRNKHLIWIKDYLDEKQIVQFMHAMDINILPYKDHNQKGTSAAVKMLLAAKKPIITTDLLYFADLENEVYKMKGEDANTIKRALNHLINNPWLQQKLVESGNDYLREKNWNNIGKEYFEFYNSL
ncbi:glycosyltransferase [Bacillus sp. CFBP 13597]|nr:glycosyltransferase [Bacillus sp. CFBP 13597]